MLPAFAWVQRRTYKDWDGVFYPSGMLRRKLHPLLLVARCFDVVEINTSFYGRIKPNWPNCGRASPTTSIPISFSPPSCTGSFTHSPYPLPPMEPTSAASIRRNDEDERLAREGLEALAATGKFGALLIQFPVSFKNTSLNREYLETLLRQFIEYPRAVEVRHATWNNPETLAYFAERNVSFCNIDQPQIGRSSNRLRMSLPPSATCGCMDATTTSGLKPKNPTPLTATTTFIRVQNSPDGKTAWKKSRRKRKSPT